jgi:ABC-2 type transport system ATP-binding protein
MLQRIGIAQALIGAPDLLILDEPLTGLDPIGRKEIKDLILEQKAQGKTIFFSSHILPDAEAVCDRIAIILHGEIMQVGELKTFLQKGIKTDEISLEEWFFQQVKGSPVNTK